MSTNAPFLALCSMFKCRPGEACCLNCGAVWEAGVHKTHTEATCPKCLEKRTLFYEYEPTNKTEK